MSNLTNGDTARRQRFDEVDDFAVRNAMAVARAVVTKAKAGDKTCMELYYKYLQNPLREHLHERQHDTSKPLPLTIRIAAFRLTQLGVLPQAGPLQLSEREYNALPMERRLELQGKVQFVPDMPAADVAVADKGAAQVANSAEYTNQAPPAAAPREPNATCSDCGKPFFTTHPLQARRCPWCRKTRQQERLRLHLERKRERRLQESSMSDFNKGKDFSE